MRSSGVSAGIDLWLRENAAVGLRHGMTDGIGPVEGRIEKSEVRDGRRLGHAVSLTHENVRQGGKAAGKVGR